MILTFSIAANLAAFIISLMLFIAAIQGGSARGRIYRAYFAMVLVTLLGAPGDMLLLLLLGIPGRAVHIVIRTVDFINFLAMGITLPVAGAYFYEFISTKTHVPRAYLTFHIVLGVLVTVLVIIAQFVPILVSLDEGNNYHKERLFWLFELFPVLALFAGITLTLSNLRHLKAREWSALLLYCLIPMVCYALETFIADLWITYLGSAVSLFLIYINIQVDLRHQLIEKEAELAQGRIAIMLSQIQPHFIFNTLSSISEVCGENELAQKCLITFSEYLRVNMDALGQKTLIPFAQELEHVQQYLWLEQLRFEDRLQVGYDIQEKDFLVPVLTLQPIAENAVRHGITARATPGRVLIRTEKTRHGFRISVIDDGVGFDIKAPPADGRSHIGLDNVRARLSAMCGGKLSIQSMPGCGTTVTIDMPGERSNSV